ncbi:MAG: AI-2E family transporter YdiK [Candidatus Rokuibacteriota bacterium]
MTTAPSSWDVTRILLAVVSMSALIAASLWLLKPFLPSVIWATMIVVATWPAMRAVQARLWGKRSLAVAVMTLAMFVAVVAPLSVATLAVVAHLDEIVVWSRSIAGLVMSAPPDWVRDVPLVGKRVADEWGRMSSARPEDLTAQITPYLKGVLLWGISQVGGLGALFIQFFLMLAVSTILYARGERAAAGVLAFARRLAGEEGERVAVLSAQAIRAVALGIVVTALAQSLVGGIGLAVTGVPYAALLTAVMFLMGVAQVGATPVLLGAVVWLYWKDGIVWGTVLLVWAVATGTLDNFLRPILIRKGADLPLLLIFAGVLGGVLAFGIVGLFVGPVVLAVTYTLLVAWVTQGTAPPAAGTPPVVDAGSVRGR